jgi:hypothetical protein
MKIKKLVHITLDEEKHEDDKAEGTMTLIFTEATPEDILHFGRAVGKFIDRFGAKQVPHPAGDNKGRGPYKWGIPFKYADDRKAYQKRWKICKTLNMKYPQAVEEIARREQEKAAKSDPKVKEQPADPPGQPAQKESPVKQSVVELQPGDHGTVEEPAADPQPIAQTPVKQPAAKKHPPKKDPRKPGNLDKKEPVKSAFGLTVGNSVKMISGPEAVPGIGTVIGFSGNPLHTRKIQVKWFNNIRWLKPDQLELVKKEEP